MLNLLTALKSVRLWNREAGLPHFREFALLFPIPAGSSFNSLHSSAPLSLHRLRRYTTLHQAAFSMSINATRRAPMMLLRDLVLLYRSLAGEFGKPVALSAFQLSDAETERLFSSYDEDYHISRFFHFFDSAGEKFSINGAPATHVSLDAQIESLL
jgi:hypothetical protein